jgi:hypothetical protein
LALTHEEAIDLMRTGSRLVKGKAGVSCQWATIRCLRSASQNR